MNESLRKPEIPSIRDLKGSLSAEEREEMKPDFDLVTDLDSNKLTPEKTSDAWDKMMATIHNYQLSPMEQITVKKELASKGISLTDPESWKKYTTDIDAWNENVIKAIQNVTGKEAITRSEKFVNDNVIDLIKMTTLRDMVSLTGNEQKELSRQLVENGILDMDRIDQFRMTTEALQAFKEIQREEAAVANAKK